MPFFCNLSMLPMFLGILILSSIQWILEPCQIKSIEENIAHWRTSQYVIAIFIHLDFMLIALQSDFRLVTNNAKMFNPPGSIYHTEAQRLETWGLEHIAKASSTVIQYETDWNIDVEKDDDATPVNIDGDDDDTTTAPTPMDVDSTSLRERSASVVSQPPPVAGPSSRRGPRGPYRRQTQASTAPGALSETLEPDGGLPGSKDGLGAFPPGSDWAKTMLALKLKGMLQQRENAFLTSDSVFLRQTLQDEEGAPTF